MNNPLIAVRPEYAVIETVWFSNFDRAFDSARDELTIFRMDKRHCVTGDVNVSRLKTKDAIELVRPGYGVAAQVPVKTADVGQPLGFGQLVLALLEPLIRLLPLRDLPPQLLIRSSKFVGSLSDSLLQLFIQSLYFGLGLLKLRGLDDLPLATPLGNGELVSPRNVKNLISAGSCERVGTGRNNALIWKQTVKLLFEFAKLFPVVFLKPGRASVNSYSGITFGYCVINFLLKSVCDSAKIERSAVLIPLVMGNNFYAAVQHVALKVRQSLSQRLFGFFQR